MKGKKKQLLGFVGLALVFAMTAIAYSLPAPGAAAQDLNISVTVTADEGSARIISPEQGASFVSGQKVRMAANLSLIRSATMSATCKNGNGDVVFSEEWTPELASATTIVSKDVELPEDMGEATCVASISARGLDNLPYEDSVSFTFRAMSIPGPGGSEDDPVKPPVDPDEPCEGNNCGNFDEENNPIVDVVVGDNVETVTVQVYDKDDNPVFVDANGEPKAIATTKDAFKDGKLTITLPMSDYNAKAGKYAAVFTATNSKGEIVSVNTYWFEYLPIAETPNTGSLFKDLNLSRADYLLTGLVAFGAIAGFAVYLVFRKSRR